MAKYRVLWLDDDFQADEKEPAVDLRREALLSDLELAADYDLDVDTAADSQEFMDKLAGEGTYEAVIFDLRGLDPEDIDNIYVMPDAKEAVDSRPGILQYVYSANLNDPLFGITLRKLPGRCFSKAKGPEEMFGQIKDDLDEALHCYQGHEECLDLFHGGYLDGENRDRMDQIMRHHLDRSSGDTPYNDMRHILENMLNTLDVHGVFPADRGKPNSRIKFLTEECIVKVDTGKPDYDTPCFPFEKCGQEVKHVLNFLWKITNYRSHFFKESVSYLREGETIQEYRILLQEMAYSAFFIVMKWYYGYMSKYHSR